AWSLPCPSPLYRSAAIHHYPVPERGYVRGWTFTEAVVAREINRLTGADLRRSKPGVYADGGGLYLQITEAQDHSSINRSWLFRFAIGRHERWMGLGSLNTVSLTEARERARQGRLMVLDGIDPIDARKERRAKEAAASKR